MNRKRDRSAAQAGSGLALALLALGVPDVAAAHVAQGDVAGGLVAGFLHPILGFDHVVAMVAVGLWGAILGRPAIYVLPITFPLVMAFGGVLGILGVPLPGVEIGVAASAVVLGAMVAMQVRAPLWIAAALVALFAIFHGYAHGAELPGAANAIAYAVGFVVATGLLHAVGIAIGVLKRSPSGTMIVRAAGGFVALVGVYYLWRSLSGDS